MKKLITCVLIIFVSYGFTYSNKKQKPAKDIYTCKKETKAPDKKAREVMKPVEESVFHPLILLSFQ